MATRRHTGSPRRRRSRTSAPSLGARPVWEGNLRLSLVSCPIRMYSAISAKHDIHFHLINPRTHNRIRMVPTDPETGPVDRSDLVKGYEFEKNRYAIVTPDELKAVQLETTDNLAIENFVDAASIDRLYLDEPYYLLPADDESVEAYSVIREALRVTERVALGRVVMHNRERLMALNSAGRGLLAYSLRMRDEVVDPQTAFGGIPAEKPDPKMIDIARHIIEQNEAPFYAGTFEDRYEEALRKLVERKQGKRKATIEAPPPERSNVIDLMDALQKSLRKKSNEHAPRRGSRAKAR